MGVYEVWSPDGDLVGVYLEWDAADQDAWRGGGTVTYSAPSLDSRGGGGYTKEMPILAAM